MNLDHSEQKITEVIIGPRQQIRISLLEPCERGKEAVYILQQHEKGVLRDFL